MSTVVNLGSKTAAVGKKWLLWLGGALLVFVGLLGPATPLGQVALAFAAQVPQTPTFSLAQGTLYLFETWTAKDG